MFSDIITRTFSQSRRHWHMISLSIIARHRALSVADSSWTQIREKDATDSGKKRLGYAIEAGEKVVAQHCPDWNQAHVPAITRACGVCCSALPHPGQAAPDSSRGPRHHSPKHARPQERVLSTGRVRSSGRARLGQSAVLHQHVGHGLAQ
jgi:hypothetical protein